MSLMVKSNSSPTGKKTAKRLLEVLIDYANGEIEECKDLKIEVSWRKNSTHLLVITEVKFLVELTTKDNNEKLFGNEIKEAFQGFKDILHIWDDRRTKTQGAKQWEFILKLWSIDKDENLKRVEQEWTRYLEKESVTISSQAFAIQEADNGSPSAISPDWRPLCLTILERKRRLTVDYWLNGAHRLPFEQLDFVPLGLLQRKKDQTNQSIGYAVTESFDTEEKFFDEVLRDGKNSPKSQGRRLAIIGESGAGKTTLLLKIGFWMLEKTDEVPIWIDGREVGTKPLHQYLKEWLQEASETLGSLPPEWIANLEQHLEHGRICLLLDGIEEQGSQLTKKLTSWVGKCRVVLTCRTSIWNSSKDALEVLEFDTYQTLGFRLDQIKQCIDAWFASDAEHLWAELNQPRYHRIKELVTNPLYLTFLCRTWQPQRQLPSTKAGLIQWFLNTDYDRSISESTKPQKQDLINSLGQLAKQAIERDEYPLSRSLVCSQLGESDEDLFKLAIKQLGWLQRVSPYSEEYEFLHDSFKEYFAAKTIRHWDYFLKHIPQNPDKGTYLIFDPKWKEVILLWLGRKDVENEEKEKFVNTLVNFEDKCGEYYNFRSYLLGAEAISELSQEHNKTREIVNQIIKWSFGYFNIECQEQQIDVPRQIKEAAKAILPKTHRSIVVECLIDLLATPNEYTRIEVAESLGEIVPGHPQAIATLMNLSEQSSVHGIRIQAVIPLVKIGKNNQEKSRQIEPNHPRLEPVQVITKYTPFQESVNSGKINPNSPQVIKSLINEVRFSADKLQQLNAVKNLGDTLPGYPETINRLIEVIINPTTDENVLLEAISSLGRIGKNDQNAIRLLISIIRDSQQNLEILEETVRALRYTDTSHQEAINTLINLICTSPDKQISRGATRSLRQILQRHQSKPAVLALKNCLLEAQKDLDIYLCCYELLWLCAQNMAYKDFYEVWQGSKLLTQSLDFGNLPQSLNSAISNDSQLRDSVKLICIDGSKFIEPDNPSGKIYSEMVKQGCSKSDDGTPKTMPDLQSYWDLLDSEKQIVLVLYENPKGSEPKDFSKCFLDAISKFDGLICIVSSQIEENLCLPQFLCSDYSLIENIVKWIKYSIIENR
jgi:HEAT repeat protein/energy-coupling factor transporter ATP-binding protein EcfA2